MKLSIWLVVTFLLVSCYDTAFDSDGIVSNSDLDYLDENYSKSGIPNDAYRIVYVKPTSVRTWSVVVEFSGGCSDHFFYTWWQASTLQDSPDRIELFLFHDGQGDICEAIVRDTVEVDLDDALQGKYDGAAIVTLVNETIGQRVKVDPYVVDYVLGKGCAMSTSLQNTTCGQGIWAYRWLKLEDSVSNHKHVWLQPVRDQSGVSIPDPGEYHVGATLLFGYEYATVDASCLSYPDGAIYPVMIQCITPD